MSAKKMHPDFREAPKTLEEVGLRLDYLRSEGKLRGVHGPATIGEAASLIGTSTEAVAESKRFYDSDRNKLWP
jgi:hypothetical protein